MGIKKHLTSRREETKNRQDYEDYGLVSPKVSEEPAASTFRVEE
jgi:hypothetical protein